MATSELLRQLETCAQILMAPPDNITPADRSKAEQVFLDFQKTKSPFELCREILENCRNQYVLYQTGTCLKNAVIREWSVHGPEHGRALFNYLFEYVNRCPLDQYVVEELMRVAAVIFKRLSLEDQNDSGTMLGTLFDIIKNKSSALNMRMNACSLIIEILNQYSSLNYNSDFALSWYAQHSAKRALEKHRLKDIFKNSIAILFEHIEMPEETRRTMEWIKLSARLIRICEIILSWNFSFSLIPAFIHVQFANARDRTESLVFNPPANWMEFIVEANVVPFFFKLFLTVRPIDPNLVHSSLNCLTQLSTMNPPFFFMGIGLTVRKKITILLVMNMVPLCNMILDTISIHEVVFVANIFNSICIHLRSYSAIQNFEPFDLLKNFMGILFNFTCKIMLKTSEAKVKNNDEEEIEKCNQALEYLMNSVMLMVNACYFGYQDRVDPNEQAGNHITREELMVWTKPLFETYLRIHLSEPEGLLPLSMFVDNDEVEEFEEDDNCLYREQLSAIGIMAQADAAGAVNTLTQLIIMKLQQYEACIRIDGENQEKIIQWTRISEDLHWILMVSTYVLTLYSSNEPPREIIRLSIQCSADVQTCLAALQNGDFSAPNIDPLVRFFIVVFKLIQMEKQMLENGMSRWVSPQLSYSLSHFISRFMHVYLIPIEFDNEKSELSLTLLSCFGADSPYVKNLVNFLLEHLETKFLYMSSEPKVLEISSRGLETFCKYKTRMRILCECDALQRLLQRFPYDPNFRKLNSAVRRSMYYVFMMVYHQKVNLVIDPLIESYRKCCIERLNSADNLAQTQEEFLIIVDSAIGLSIGLGASTFSKVWPDFLKPFYNHLPQVLKVMHKSSMVVQAIFEAMLNFSICFCSLFTDQEGIEFHETAVAILNEYALHNRATYTTDSSRIEELQAELIWILKFLNDLCSQSMFFFFSVAPSVTSLGEAIGKVALTSLNIIMPLINDQLLENQQLCLLYYRLLEFVAQNTERFKSFPVKLFENYLRSVEYAFKAQNIPNEIKTIGFKILAEVCIQTTGEPNEEMLTFLKPFFQIIVEFIFYELAKNNDSMLRDAVATALFSLICCFSGSYTDLIRQAMRCVGDIQVEERICSALFTIINENGLGRMEASRTMFRKRFSEFINEINNMLTLR